MRARASVAICLLLLSAALSAPAGDDDSLLAQVLGSEDAGEAGIEDVLDLNLDDIDDDVHGQKEIPSMEDIIEEERGYFLRTDRDGDKKLSKAEFVQHFLDSMGDFSGVNSSSDDDHVEDAAFSFTEFDLNADSYVDWDEWSQMMFHEAEQDPEYRDGEAVEEEFPTAEQLKHLKRLFEQGDTDASGTLSKEELAQVLRRADGMTGESSLSDDEIEMISWQLFDDQDVNKDMQLSLEEWNQGGGYLS